MYLNHVLLAYSLYTLTVILENLLIPSFLHWQICDSTSKGLDPVKCVDSFLETLKVETFIHVAVFL